VTAFRQALHDKNPEVRRQAVRTVAVLQVAALDDELGRLADGDQDGDLRLEALRAVVLRRPTLAEGSFELLLSQVRDRDHPLARLAAAEVLGRARLSDAQVLRLLPAVGGDALVAPAVLLPALMRARGDQAVTAVCGYLEEALRTGWRPGEPEMAKVLQSLPPEARDRAAVLRRLWEEGAERQRARLGEFEPLLAGGDVGRGRAIFFGKKVACATCHRVGNTGGTIGPDLTRIGAVRSGRDILEAVVVPSSTIAQGYETYAVTTTDDRLLTGLIARQSADVLVLRDSSGAELRLPRSQVQEVRRLPTSLMPEGQERALTREEFRDLLAFLQGMK
jgi:putative heme-binding domain-containing protein